MTGNFLFRASKKQQNLMRISPAIEYVLFNAENVGMIRRSLLYIYHNAELDQSTKELIVDAKYKFGYVYNSLHNNMCTLSGSP